MHPRRFLPFLAAAALAACAAMGRRHQPAAASAGLVFGSLQFKKAVIIFPDRYADIMHLAPIDSRGELDYDHPLSSQWAAGELVYFFNVPPGRYAVIGGSFLAHGLRYTFRLLPEQARQCPVEAKAGEAVFLGVVMMQRQLPDLLPAGLHALKNAALLLPPWRPYTAEVEATFKAVDTTRLSEIDALVTASRDLAGTLWTAVVRERLDRLGGPVPEPVTTGFWRKRSKPALRSKSFTWIDTLEWGRPFVIKDGLEWRQPKDKARIAVRFHKEGAPGFQPLEDYLHDLRALGSTEDTHAFETVVLPTGGGSSIRYTKYIYPEPFLTGSVQDMFVTEATVVPGQGGYYVVQYRARKDDFPKFYPQYLRFREHLLLAPPALPEEERKS